MYRATLLGWAISLLLPQSVHGQAITLKTTEPVRFELTDLPDPLFAELQRRNPGGEEWQELFPVFLVHAPSTASRTPMLGTWELKDRQVVFTPRFPLRPGMRYRAEFQIQFDGRRYRAVGEFTTAAAAGMPATRVVQVYPSKDLLPENQLKFYFHFSAPMSRGEAYRRIHLFNSAGKEVTDAFVELDEELWDPRCQRFTLLIEPGRIKRGLKPREELGPVLEEGKSYTLVVDRDWLDATGKPLQEVYRKRFRVGPPDDQCPDIKTWRLEPPTVATTAPLTLTLPESLDQALLERLLTVVDSQGKTVAGQVRVCREETCWQFTPAQPWQVGRFEVVVDAVLEDLAGNSLAKPFELDVFEKIDRQIQARLLRIPFQIKSRESNRSIKQ